VQQDDRRRSGGGTIEVEQMENGSPRMMNRMRIMTLIAASAFVLISPLAKAEDPATFEVMLKDGKFEPAEVKAPANTAIVLKVKNMTSANVEFESEPLQFETVVKPNAEVLVKVKAQKPGRYVFFDDLHQDIKGALLVE
jgi:plastocyanin